MTGDPSFEDAPFEGAPAARPDAPPPARESILKAPLAKGSEAFLTISELAGELGVPQHILRYWETRFAQLRPLQRAGNRRYYRPADVAVARRIHRLLEEEHYTIKGVQRVLAGKSAEPEPAAAPQTAAQQPITAPTPQNQHSGVAREALMRVRTLLREALDADAS